MWQSVPIDACLVNGDSGFLQQVNTIRNGQLSLTVELFNIHCTRSYISGINNA